jgi:hypothetical protein
MNVCLRLTVRNIGAKRSFKNFDVNVAGACIDATIARNCVSGYEKKRKRIEILIF